MNSEAASETQYEDSKPHFTKYRKDAKIMLRRKLLSVLLALVLVVSMAVPALAVSGNWGGMNYSLTAHYNTSLSSITMSVSNATVKVYAAGRGYIYALGLNQRAWNGWYRTGSSINSTTATHYIQNYIYVANGTLYTGTIEAIEGKGYIGEDFVGNVSAP